MSKYVGRIITDQAPAGYSVAFDGASDYLSLAANAAFAFGTGNFTVEFWVYYASASANYIFYDGRGTSISNTGFCIFNTGGTIYAQQGTATLITATAPTANAWHHIAFSRSGSSNKLFVDGTQVGSTATDSTNYSTNYSVGIGAPLDSTYTASYSLNGYLSNVRVVKGTALYTAAFIPPTQLLNVTNTSLLTCNSPAIVDQSSNAFAITTNGNAAVSTFTPFTAYNVAPTSAFPLTPAPGVWTLDEAMQYTQQGVWPSPITNAIEDVFSTYLYTGNGSTQTITNNINLSGQGGLVWLKSRSNVFSHALYDTARGATLELVSNSTAAQTTETTGLTSFNSDGFSIGSLAKLNTNAATYVSWTFRKQAKFFDIVTYTGNGSATRTISHNLGSVPGFIIIKERSAIDDWCVLAGDSSGNYQYLYFNTAVSSGSVAKSSVATSTTIDIAPIRANYGTNAVNEASQTYVMYLFASDAGGFGATGSDNVISCGSFSANANTTVNLGWEPQFILWKNAQGANNWGIADNMRGLDVSGTVALLNPNTGGAESSSASTISINSTGFTWIPSASGNTYVYIAIRRGPMRPPSSGTSVFAPTIWTGNTPNVLDTRSISGFGKPTDLFIGSDRDTVFNHNLVYDRLRGTDTTGGKLLYTHNTSTEAANANSGSYSFAQMDGITLGNYVINYSGRLDVGWFFGRAPGFFDVVCYTGNGTNRTVSHNLQVVPELMIIKNRSNVENWGVYSAAIGNTKRLRLNATDAATTAATEWNNTSPTASVFTVGTDQEVNFNGNTYVAYLFATVGGVSKVGSYTGTGTTQQINCGFTNGSRFVMIKRTDSTGDWYVWDSARGIVAGNDPYLLLNSTAAEVTNTDYVDTYSLGFELSSTAPAALNASGGSYIFLAIA